MFEMRKSIADICANKPIGGKSVSVRMEAPQEKKELYTAGAKALGWLQAQGIARERTKPEWGPPLNIYYKGEDPAARWQELATYKDSVWSMRSALFAEILPDSTEHAFIKAGQE